jgi:hypothetical protein
LWSRALTKNARDVVKSLQHGAKPWKVSIALFVDYSRTIRGLFVLFADYSYYSPTNRTIRGLFVLFFAYSRTIRTIRWLFADYSYYSSTIRTIRTIRFTILVLSIAISFDMSCFHCAVWCPVAVLYYCVFETCKVKSVLKLLYFERYSSTFHFTKFLSHFLNKLMLNRNYFLILCLVKKSFIIVFIF